jgi:hypothetical protein
MIRGKKTPENTIHDKTREWQAYYEMLFMNNTCKFLNSLISQTLLQIALEYYNRMGEGTLLNKICKSKNKSRPITAR